MYHSGTSSDKLVADLDASTWYNIALVWTNDSNVASLYVDGELVCDTVTTTTAATYVDKVQILSMNNRDSGGIAYIDNLKLYGNNSDEPYYANDFEAETIGKVVNGWDDYSGRVSVLVEETINAPKPEKISVADAIVEDFEEKTTADLIEPWWVGVDQSSSSNGGAITSIDGTNAYKVYQNGSGMTKTYRVFKPTEKLTVSFDYLISEAAVKSGSYISLSPEEGNWAYSICINKVNESDTRPMLRYGPNYTNFKQIECGKWYNFKFEYDNGTVNFYIEDEFAFTIPTDKTDITSIDRIFFATSSNNSSVVTYYVDNLTLIGAEDFIMNDTPNEFTDTFDKTASDYTFAGGGSYSVNNGKLTLVGDISAKREVVDTQSGLFGFDFEADKLEGITVTLYQDNIEAVVVKFEEDGTLVGKILGSEWAEISDPGKLKAGEQYSFALDLPFDRLTNNFDVLINGILEATAPRTEQFNKINSIKISVPAGSTVSIDSLYVLESNGIIEAPEREESSPEIYVPTVIEGTKTMYLASDKSPLESTLSYASSSTKLTLDTMYMSIGVDLGSVQKVNAIRITGVSEMDRPVRNSYYKVYQSDDNINWVQVKGFSFNHFTENGVSVALFEVTGVEARYVKVRCQYEQAASTFEIASVRAEVRTARQWKMAGYAMYALDDTNPAYTAMTRELYDKAITIKKGDSVGINFGVNSHVEAIELVGSGLSGLDASAFELYTSNNNAKYTRVENVILSRDERDGEEVYRLSFPDTVCGYLKLHAVADMNVQLADLYDGLCAYSSVEADSGISNVNIGVDRGGEGDFYTLPNGTLVMMYTGYPADGSHGDYADNVIKAVQSTDGGYTWSEAWITLKKEDGDLNVMCPSYHYMANGDLAILYIEKISEPSASNLDAPSVAHIYIRRSSDNGRTWGSPICITEKPVAYSSLSSAVNGLHLSNGRFIVALTVDLNLEGTATGRDRVLVYTVYSDDDGYTWKKSATAVTHPHAACEPVVAELENGNLLMTVRTRVTGKIFQSISTDSGNTWSELAEVPNMVTPSSTNAVLSIPSTDDILIVWNNEEISNINGGNGNRDPLCYAVSTDNGLSYKNLRNIVDGHATWPCIRFYGRAVYMQHGNTVRITDVAELYYTRNGSVTTANLPTAATPNATYSNGWLTGVTANMKYSLDGGVTWFFCGGTSVQIGDVVGTIMIKDIGTATIAPSGTQIIGTTDVNVADIGILPGEVSEESLNTFITMAKEGVYDFKFNSGVYVFPKTIVLPSNISIVGDVDTVFMLTESASGKAASASVISIGSGIDNVRISNLTLKGYNETAYCPTAVSRHIGIAVDSALRVNIDNVNFIGFADSGIKITNMGSSFWNDKSYDEKQAYFKGLQLSNCLFEKNYYGINLGSRAEYCEFSNVTAGYNNVGCVNSGGNNSFVNCFFNNNVTGFYLDCTGKSNPGHGGVTGCSFNHNTENAVVIEGNKIGFSFTGCQFFDGKIKQSDSCGTIFSACVLGSVQFEVSGSAGSGILTGCFFQSDSATILAGNNGVFTVTDCVDLYSAKTTTVSSDFNAEPAMVLLSATKEGVKTYDEITTLDASDFGVVPGNVSAEALDALIAKANEGGYTFKFDGGTYLLPKTIVLPSDTMLMGNGSTVFRLADGVIGTSANKAVLSIGSGVDNVRISNIIFEGSNTTPYCPTAKSNYLGIYISGALRVSIDNVTARGFNNAGLKIESVGYNFDHNDFEGSQAYFRGVKVTDCRFEGNYYGICLGRRAEYCQFTNVYSCYNNVGCDNEGGNNSFVNCSFNNNNKGFWMPCFNMPNPGHGGASGCTFIGNNTTAIEISDNSNGFTFNACSINGNIVVKNALGTIFNACIIDGALDAQGTSGSGILLACRLAGDIASVTDGVFMIVDCLTGASANLSVATPTTLDYTKPVGTTINVADIGITSGTVSESALDSLMTLAANGGYTFVFGGGVYKFTKTLALPSNTTIIGNATTVLTLTGSNVGKVPVVSVIGVDNVRISGLTVKGELTQNYVADQIYSKDGSVGIHISRSSRVNLDNVRVLNFQYAAVLVDNVGADCVETVQISDCRFENSYYGLCLAENANYCQVVGTAMGYCSIGGIDSGAYNVFANCAFNKNRYGFYVYHTNFANAGAGMAINCCFNHNDSQGSSRPSNYQGIQIDNCQSGYIFSGCQLFGNLKQTNSTGVVISSTIFGSSVTTISGTAESNVMNGCFFQTDKTAILAGNNGVYKVVDCIEIPN